MMTLKAIKANAGATLNKAGQELDYPRGYQVSVRDLETIKARDLRKKHIKEMLDKLDEDSCLGIWIDKGLAYIDESKRFTNKREATRFGKKNKQISIWDWGKKEAVYL